MIKIAILLIFTLSTVAQAQDSRSRQEEQLRQRVAELEKTVQTLQDKVQKMESTLMKGGGFMITSNVTCEINTPFNGNFVATELSLKAAQNSVVEQCKNKVADKSQCATFLMKCDK